MTKIYVHPNFLAYLGLLLVVFKWLYINHIELYYKDYNSINYIFTLFMIFSNISMLADNQCVWSDHCPRIIYSL